MPYLCENCEAEFEDPLWQDKYIQHGEFVEHEVTHSCPYCTGTVNFTDVRCACGNLMMPGMKLCYRCKKTLRTKLHDVLTDMNLTPTEAEEIDAMLEGESIADIIACV